MTRAIMTDPAMPADDRSLPSTWVDGDSPPESLQGIQPAVRSSGDVLELVDGDLPEDVTFQPRWYLGLAEAGAWFMGTLGVHLVGGVFFAILMMVVISISDKPMRGITPHAQSMMDPRVMMGATAGEMLCFVMAAVIAITARYWGRAFKELNMSSPDPRHVMIVVLGTLPLSRLISLWSIPVQKGWNIITEMAPKLRFLDQMSVMEAVKGMAEVTPLIVLILVIAVLPAIGEEIVFRGAIGRVLICHLGLWAGLLLTSFLFGLIHIHPVHAVTVMPLGLAIHLLYLGSRSFWIPMLLHFENNTFASIMTKLGTDTDAANAPMTWRDGIQIVSAIVTVIAFGIALWRSRIRYVDSNGIEQDSVLFPLRVPGDSGISRRSGPIGAMCLTIGLVFAAICHGGLVLEILDPAQNLDQLRIKEAEVAWVASHSPTRSTDNRPEILANASTASKTTRFR